MKYTFTHTYNPIGDSDGTFTIDTNDIPEELKEQYLARGLQANIVRVARARFERGITHKLDLQEAWDRIKSGKWKHAERRSIRKR